MEIEEYFNCRADIMAASKDQDGFLQEQDILSEVLPYMLDAKLVDSEDINDAYYLSLSDGFKLNGYAVNESGERLQLFILNVDVLSETLLEDELCVSARADYEKQFKRVSKFISIAVTLVSAIALALAPISCKKDNSPINSPGPC